MHNRFAPLGVIAILILILTTFASPQPAHATDPVLCRVDRDSPVTPGDGLDWTTAYKDLQYALTYGACDQIWVAEGVYLPSTTDPSASFYFLPGIQVFGGYGGYGGGGDNRNWQTHPTILSGDMTGNDDASNADGNFIDEYASDIVAPNSQHVVALDAISATGGIDANTKLDGFTITGGYDPGASGVGGGLVCASGGASQPCSPTLQNLTFSGNYAGLSGGAVYNIGGTTPASASSPSFTNVTFQGNRALHGGAVHNAASFGAYSSPTFTSVIFTENTADEFGGAVYNAGSSLGNSSPQFTECTFYDNHADDSGGAVYNAGHGGGHSSPTFTQVYFGGNTAAQNGGAVYDNAYGGTSSPTFLNSTFISNTSVQAGGAVYNYASNLGASSPLFANSTFAYNGSGNGGAAFNDAGTGVSSPSFLNVTLSGNWASVEGANSFGGAIANYADSTGTSLPTLRNVILWDNSATYGAQLWNYPYASANVGHSVVQGSGGSSAWDTDLGNDQGGNLDADPKLGTLGNHGGYTQTWPLLTGSSAIDTGDYGTCAGAPISDLDQRGETRPIDGDGNGSQLCDIGAYELQAGTPVNVYIAGELVGTHGKTSPSSWQHSYGALQSGPVEVKSSVNILPSERGFFGPYSTFNEVMGVPNNQLTTHYWFPWYDNKDMITWILVGNPSTTQSANVTIKIAGVPVGYYTIEPFGKITPTFGTIQNGPVEVTSDINVFTSERTLLGYPDGAQSFNEVLGYPHNQLTTHYWFTWYDNKDMTTWVLVGNPSATQTARVTIKIAGTLVGTYNIPPFGNVTPTFPGVQNGPVEVLSNINVFTSERSLFGTDPYWTFNEVMGYPHNQLTNNYWFPWYDNASMLTWVLVGNPSTTQTANVTIKIGGVPVGYYSIPPFGNVTPTFAVLPGGPVQVTSNINVFTSERALYGWSGPPSPGSSFNEFFGIANNKLTNDYWFTWYDNQDMITKLVIGRP